MTRAAPADQSRQSAIDCLTTPDNDCSAALDLKYRR
jgi:hypothetical protein